jgi:RNA polymerase sigma-70 factor (ECF subfamily)
MGPRFSSTMPPNSRNALAESTVSLLERARAGDDDARAALFARCLPALRRWARGRLPGYARDLLDTHDLVQDAAIHTLRNLDGFQPKHPGALNAYLREAVANRIKDQIRRLKRRPVAVCLDDRQPDDSASPLERAIEQERLETYEAALARLKPTDRAAIVSRIELQYSYEEIASALGKPSANAARVAVVRAIERLIHEMENGR